MTRRFLALQEAEKMSNESRKRNPVIKYMNEVGKKGGVTNCRHVQLTARTGVHTCLLLVLM